MLYEEAVSEINSYVAELGPVLARNLVNRTWRDIRDSRRWSFLKSETAIYTPAVVSTGRATFTSGSVSVVGDAAAAAAWVALGQPTLIQRQIRLGLGPVYNIVDFNGVDTLTLESAFGEPTVAGATYNLQQFYYAAPSDFLAWDSIVDPISAFSFILNWTREELNRADPQRGAVTLPHRAVTYRKDPVTGLYMYELWPTPTAAWRYPALYQKRGVDMTDGELFPDVLPPALIMARLKYHAYEWAMANKSRHEALKGVDWFNLKVAAEKEYTQVMEATKRQDEETFIQNLGSNYLYPAYNMIQFGANYWQSHAPIFGY